VLLYEGRADAQSIHMATLYLHGACVIDSISVSVWVLVLAHAGPAWSLGMRPKGGQASNGSAAVPGPGAYHPDTTAYEPDGPAYSFPPRADAGM
jgi:hypothetical protein